MSAVTTWSLTPSDNSSAPPNGFPEGQAAASVNNCARQMMSDLVREFQVNAVKVLASVSGTNTITGSMSPDLASYSAGMMVIFVPAANNTGAATLNIDSLGAKAIQKADGDALVAGDLVDGIPAVLVMYDDLTGFSLLNPQSLTLTNASFSGTLSVTGLTTLGALTATGALTLNGALTTDNSSADEVGFKGLPPNAQNGNYTLVLTDAGRMIYRGAGSAAAWTIPANSSVAFPVGTAITFGNFSSTDISIAITSDTLTLAGTTTTGTRTLAQNGVATAIKYASTGWVISGTGLS